MAKKLRPVILAVRSHPTTNAAWGSGRGQKSQASEATAIDPTREPMTIQRRLAGRGVSGCKGGGVLMLEIEDAGRECQASETPGDQIEVKIEGKHQGQQRGES